MKKSFPFSKKVMPNNTVKRFRDAARKRFHRTAGAPSISHRPMVITNHDPIVRRRPPKGYSYKTLKKDKRYLSNENKMPGNLDKPVPAKSSRELMDRFSKETTDSAKREKASRIN
tara:strand:+ start:61 stop:405 length:345 start_codon:yes stop_codon:yes gene_type:complete